MQRRCLPLKSAPFLYCELQHSGISLEYSIRILFNVPQQPNLSMSSVFPFHIFSSYSFHVDTGKTENVIFLVIVRGKKDIKYVPY